MTARIRGKVFGSLNPGTIDIHIGYNYGMNDGGGLRTLEIKKVPKDCRMPNTYVWITMKNGEIINIEKMKDFEVEKNKI